MDVIDQLAKEKGNDKMVESLSPVLIYILFEKRSVCRPLRLDHFCLRNGIAPVTHSLAQKGDNPLFTR
jgi:hypothetical protein